MRDTYGNMALAKSPRAAELSSEESQPEDLNTLFRYVDPSGPLTYPLKAAPITAIGLDAPNGQSQSRSLSLKLQIGRAIICSDAMVLGGKAPDEDQPDGDLRISSRPGGVSTALQQSLSWIGPENATTIYRELETPADGYLSARAIKTAIAEGRVSGALPEIGSVITDLDCYYGYYERTANAYMWPAFHSMPEYKQTITAEDWECYRYVNKQFAKEAILAAEGHAPVTMIVHDYQLALTPGYIRKWSANSYIGSFWHIPFPTHQVFQELFDKEHQGEILRGMLGADFIGFQTITYANNFLECLRHSKERGLKRVNDGIVEFIGANASDTEATIKWGERNISVGVVPISIDPDQIRAEAQSSQAQAKRQELRNRFPGEKIIFSLDRCDYTKGIDVRMQGLEIFLDEHPEYLGKVRLVLRAAPTRTGVPKYQAFEKGLQHEAERINRRFSRDQWRPIEFEYVSTNHIDAMGYMQAADIIAETSKIDGMHLVIKEAIIANEGRTCAYVIGRGMGAAHELVDGYMVDGGNPRDVAEGYRRALMELQNDPQEVHSRGESLARRIYQNPLSHWNEQLFARTARAVALRYADLKYAHLHSSSEEVPR